VVEDCWLACSIGSVWPWLASKLVGTANASEPVLCDTDAAVCLGRLALLALWGRGAWSLTGLSLLMLELWCCGNCC